MKARSKVSQFFSSEKIAICQKGRDPFNIEAPVGIVHAWDATKGEYPGPVVCSLYMIYNSILLSLPPSVSTSY